MDRDVVGLAAARSGHPAVEALDKRPLGTEADRYHSGLLAQLKNEDPLVYEGIVEEYRRVSETIQLIAAENRCSRAVLAALGSILQNKTTEGFVGNRFHGGCQVVDRLEQLAIERAKAAFGARYANVQPHSGTAANHIAFTALLEPGDRILHMALDQGGHVSHGASVSFTGRFFSTYAYSVDRSSYLLDYEQIRCLARQIRPRLIVCGASAYPRLIDFAAFRSIADEVGAYLVADISHIAGLIAAGQHPSPIDQAHVTTTSTYKPGGPRGGLILMGKDYDTPVKVGNKTRPMWEQIEKATFPGFQGTPYLNNIAAKAVFFREMATDQYRYLQARIIENARALAEALIADGMQVLTGGTDNHMVLVNVAASRPGMTGLVAQRALEDCGIVINMNRLPYDPLPQSITSGIRLGTPVVTRNGMGPEQMSIIAKMVVKVLSEVKSVDGRNYHLEQRMQQQIRRQVTDLCRCFPII
ncbi:MAG: serine hydroxymethyltransferase [Sedimentisphaerales bacterium]|jgi:glycine hydroxymethyltransferase|nr:serine hydroxymethyltransferase [Sedimentisphaerales bacterium]